MRGRCIKGLQETACRLLIPEQNFCTDMNPLWIRPTSDFNGNTKHAFSRLWSPTMEGELGDFPCPDHHSLEDPEVVHSHKLETGIAVGGDLGTPLEKQSRRDDCTPLQNVIPQGRVTDTGNFQL